MSRRLLTVTIAVVVSATACGGGNPQTTTATTSVATTVADVASDPMPMLDAYRRLSGAPGALAVVERDGGAWQGASGAADLAGTVITDDTRFRIASITKPITAALVLDAVARGELTLDDVVGDHLPGLLRPDQPITVRMLLDHTSGVFDETNNQDLLSDIGLLTDPALRAEAESLLTRYETGEQVVAPDRLIVALAETHDRYFEPGAGYHYSNTNYQLAGMVLEAVTGRSMADLLRERIVDPLGLVRTTIAPADRESPELRGYGTSVADGSLVDMTDEVALFGNGASGGIISTAEELLTIMQAIVSGPLLPVPLAADMKQPTGASEGSYGLGLATYDLSCGTYYGHGGLVNGTESLAIVAPDGGDGVVLAINLYDGSDLHLLALADLYLCQMA